MDVASFCRDDLSTPDLIRSFLIGHSCWSRILITVDKNGSCWVNYDDNNYIVIMILMKRMMGNGRIMMMSK